MSEQEISQFLKIVFVVGIPLILVVRFLTMGRDAEWQQLARQYPASPKIRGRMWNRESISLNLRGYGRIIKYVSNTEGLFIRLTPIPFFVEARVFIPWSEFHNAILIKGRFLLWARHVRAEVGTPPIVVRIPADVFEETEGRQVILKAIDHLI